MAWAAPARQPYGTRLRTLLAAFLDERDVASDRQTGEGVLQHAALLKVHLVAVLSFDEPVLFVWKEPHDPTLGLSSGGLHGTALSPREILQPAPGDSERSPDGHMGVLALGIEFTLLGRSCRVDVLRPRMETGLMRHDDFFSRDGQVDPDVIAVTSLVTPLGELDKYPAARDQAVISFQLFKTPADIRLESCRGRNTAECNRGWELHSTLPASCESSRRPNCPMPRLSCSAPSAVGGCKRHTMSTVVAISTLAASAVPVPDFRQSGAGSTQLQQLDEALSPLAWHYSCQRCKVPGGADCRAIGRRLLRASVVPGLRVFSSGGLPVVSTRFDRWALGRIQQTVASAPLRFVLWDGFELPPKAGPAVASIVFKNRRALFGWTWDPDLNFGEAYVFGGVEIQGDLLGMLEATYRALATRPRPWWLRQSSNNVYAAKENVHHHYDLGNEFYRLWLDRGMVYTCAYFPTPDCSLEEAQVAKMELVCRKLRLKPGERVVEAGSGWGTLALFMAKRYGVSVRAFNISAEQVAYARKRAKEAGLAGCVEFIEDDYRNVRGEYDVFASVGMIEHVGLADYPTLSDVMDRSLREHGRGLLHFIGRNQPMPLNPWIRKRIFPGAYPPTLREVFERVLEPHGFSVLDVDNLRLHYAKTLEHWRHRFEGASDQVLEMFDEAFVRAWRLYLAGSQAAFTTGFMQLFQVVFARGTSNAIPWTRIDA